MRPCVFEDGLNLSRNIVATVNLDCRLDLKTIALHARNAEYNPKVCPSWAVNVAFCGCDYEDSGSKDDGVDFCVGKDGCYGGKVGR